MSISKYQSGFTVVEVLITISVAGFILLGLFAMTNSLNLVNDRARDLTLANALAEHEIESLRSIGFSGLVDGNYDYTDEMPPSLAEPRSATYTISTALDNASGSSMPNLKKIDMTLTYDDHGSTRSLFYTSYIGELGVGQ